MGAGPFLVPREESDPMTDLPPLPEGFTLYEEYDRDYAHTLRTLQLAVPAGHIFPPHAPVTEVRPGETAIYEKGCGEVRAMFAWLTAVECAALTAHAAGDDEAAHGWLLVAAQWPETETFKRWNEPDVPVSWYDGVLAPALSGDFSYMAEEAMGAITDLPEPSGTNGKDQHG